MSPYPHPTRCARHPLPRGEGFKPPCPSEVRAVFPSPIGRRCPEGADEGSVIVFPPFSHKPATPRPYFTPAASLPEEEGFQSVPSPIGRRCPEGADEGSALIQPTFALHRLVLPNPHRCPSPGGRGVQSAPFPGQAPIRL